MKAMIAYIEYIGKDVPKGEDANSSGIYDLEFLDRAADPHWKINLPKCASHQLTARNLAETKNIPTHHFGCQFL
jgi:thiosulfate dehydrogenase